MKGGESSIIDREKLCKRRFYRPPLLKNNMVVNIIGLELGIS